MEEPHQNVLATEYMEEEPELLAPWMLKRKVKIAETNVNLYENGQS